MSQTPTHDSLDAREQAVWAACNYGGWGQGVDQLLGELEAVRQARRRLGGTVADEIWILGLQVHVLHECFGSRERALLLAEERLALQREALAGRPAELARALSRVARWHELQGGILSAARAMWLRREAGALAPDLRGLD